MKKFISFVLAFALVFSVAAVGVSAAETKTDCGGNCDNCPTIVIPGIGQSNVWLLDSEGNYVLDDNGNRVNCFPAYVQTGELVKKLLAPLLLTLFTQHDIGLSKALADAIDICFNINESDNNGKPIANLEVEKYPYSLAECSDYEKGEIYDSVPIQDYSAAVGEDHLYYFSYNSLGNHLDIVKELYDFIQQVRKETGHDKVNIVPISLGGTIANGLLEYYPDIHEQLNKVLYIVPALNGSTIVGDVFAERLTFYNPDYLYNGFLEELMDENEARMIESVLRIFPDEVLMKCLHSACESLISILTTSTNLWALVPNEDYPALAQRYLSTPEKAEIRRQTDIYYRAQSNSDANILRLVENGVKVYNIVDYDFPLYNVGTSWNIENADGVIQLDSTSMGAYSANCGETLPADYIQKNTYCTVEGHNHISPDRVVDASAGLLPDTTFYFDNQGHEGTGRNDIIMKLATAILATDEIVDVYSTPDFPQFNVGRETKKIRNDLLPKAKSIDPSTLSAQDAAELAAAIAEAEEMLNRTVGVEGEAQRIEARLKACLVTAGLASPAEEKEDSDFFEKLSLWLYKNYGTQGYSEMLPTSVNLFFKTINQFLNNKILAPINDLF